MNLVGGYAKTPYLGYVLRVQGEIGDEEGEFLIGIGKAAQVKHLFRGGDRVHGWSAPAVRPELEPAEFYKTVGLKVIQREEPSEKTPTPWLGAPPELAVYRWSGHRRLSARTYAAKCSECIWGCQMAVEMTIDQ